MNVMNTIMYLHPAFSHTDMAASRLLALCKLTPIAIELQSTSMPIAASSRSQSLACGVSICLITSGQFDALSAVSKPCK